MRLVTWNLNGLDDAHLDERIEAAVFTSILGARLDELQAGTAKPIEPPDVIVYQEVVARTFAAHLTPHLTAGGYTLLPNTAPKRQTFEVIAYREPLRLRAYVTEKLRESDYGRELHVADFAIDGSAWRVLTGHFDSGTEAGRVRIAQLNHVNALLGDRGVFAGDANLRKAEWDATKDGLEMTDAWEDLGSPAATRVTWRRHDYKARFDRVFVGSRVRVTSMSPLGMAPIPGLDVAISDHVGLLVEFASS